MVVVRVTSCKQGELDAALGQMTVKSKACTAASDMPRSRQWNKIRDVYNSATMKPMPGRKVRINSYKMKLLGMHVYLWLNAY